MFALEKKEIYPRKRENSSFCFHFLTLGLMKTRVCWSKKQVPASSFPAFVLSKPTLSRAKSEKSPRFMHKKTRNHPLTLSFFRPTALPHAHPPTEFSKHDYFSDDVNLHQLPTYLVALVPLTSPYANQRSCLHRSMQVFRWRRSIDSIRRCRP